jgi:F-type H+-transporting ATPase subunit b
VEEARKEAQSIKRRAEADIEAQRKKAAGELKNDISAIALELAGKVVGKELDGETRKDLIDGFINDMGDLS